MLCRRQIYISITIIIFVLSQCTLWLFRAQTTPIVLINHFKHSDVVGQDLLPNGTYRFQRFNTSQDLIAVSAYWQQDNKHVRVFIMKQNISQPRIQCSFGYNHGPSSILIPSTDCRGREYKFYGWYEFTATLCGFSICCPAPDNKSATAYTTLYLSLAVDNSLPGATVNLPIHRSLPDPKKKDQFPHTFGVCIAPIFNMKQFTMNFLVDFFEMHRAMGAELFIVYLADEPTRDVKQVLDSYQSHASLGPEKNMTVIVIPWYLSPFMDAKATWAHTQIIAYNDCLYRFGRSAEYFVMTDLDELLVPNPRFGYSWSNMLKAFKASAGYNYSTSCSYPLRMWLEPQTNKTKLSVYYAEKKVKRWPLALINRKCIVRSGLVQLFHVHEALYPTDLYEADDFFIILHYRRFNDDGPPDPEVDDYRYIWPLRDAIQPNIDRRLSHIAKLDR